MTYWYDRCACQHERIKHIDDNDRGMSGCQVDIMTPDGPEMCGCVRFNKLD